MNSLYEDKQKEKKEMINDIIRFSDLFKDAEELMKKDYRKIKSTYHSCLIPLLKGGYVEKNKRA